MKRTLLAFAAGLLAAGLVAAAPREAAPAGEDIQLVATNGVAGKPNVTNSLDGRPVLTISNVQPGQSRTGQVTLKNTGSAPERVWVWQTALTTGPAGRPDLSAWVRLSVYDSALARTVYVGPYNGFPPVDRPIQLCGVPTKKDACPSWAKGESHTYTFTVTFPDAAAGSGVNVNSYQSTWLRSQLDWTSAI